MNASPRSDLPSWALLVFGLLALLALGVWIARSHEASSLPPELAPVKAAPAPIPAQGSLPQDSRWRLIHVLAPGCSYSEGVARDLLRRGSYSGKGAEERVVWIGKTMGTATRMAWAGWNVSFADPQDRNGCGIGGAPWLLVFDPSGKLRYSGPYWAGRAVENDEIEKLAHLGAGEALPEHFRRGSSETRYVGLDESLNARIAARMEAALTSAAR